MIKIKETNDLSFVKKFLFRYKFNPYKYYYSGVLNITDNTFLNLFYDKNKTYLYIEKNGEIKGVTSYFKLEWDSKILGFGVGKIDFLAADGGYDNKFEIKNLLINRMIEKCREDDINYILCRTYSDDLSSINSLISNGFILVDGNLKFSLNLKDMKTEDINHSIQTRLVKPEDINQVKKIASESFQIDRFHSDPIVTKKKADEIHELWAENSCKNIAADAVIVGLINGEVVSFVTCKIDRIAKEYFNLPLGVIVLVATAKKFRRKGIAKHTTFTVLEWFKENNIEIVEVGTQISNIGASQLYESIGFKLIYSSLTFRNFLN